MISKLKPFNLMLAHMNTAPTRKCHMHPIITVEYNKYAYKTTQWRDSFSFR